MTAQPGELIATRIDDRVRIDHADPVIRISASLLRMMHADPGGYRDVTITCAAGCPLGDTIAIDAVNMSLSYKIERAEPGGVSYIAVKQ